MIAPVIALALRLGAAGASALGVSLPALALLAGLALGAGPAGYAGWLLGQWRGYATGYAAADVSAQLNDEARRRREVERDLETARIMASALRQGRAADETARRRAEKQRDAYREELAKRSDRGACALSGADLRRLQRDYWRRGPRADRAQPAGG